MSWSQTERSQNHLPESTLPAVKRVSAPRPLPLAVLAWVHTQSLWDLDTDSGLQSHSRVPAKRRLSRKWETGEQNSGSRGFCGTASKPSVKARRSFGGTELELSSLRSSCGDAEVASPAHLRQQLSPHNSHEVREQRRPHCPALGPPH